MPSGSSSSSSAAVEKASELYKIEKMDWDNSAKQVDDPSQSARAFYVSSSEPKD